MENTTDKESPCSNIGKSLVSGMERTKYNTTVTGCTGQVVIGDNATLHLDSTTRVPRPVEEKEATGSTEAHIPCQESSASELDEVVIKVKTGYVLLVHNYIFPSRTNVARLGSEKDVKNLKSLFDDFGFRGSGVHENLTADELMKVLQDTSEKDFLKYDCFFCVIMSHGSQDGIFGVDDKVVHVDAITSMFRRNECPSLEGKPKVFLIQACRGIQQDMVPVEADSDVTSMPYPMLPSDADFLICFSSAPGYQSYRQRELGSWFLSTVVKVFRKYAHSEHLMDMMLRVNNEVAQYSSPSGHKQMPCEVCMLTKKVFFETKYLV